MTVRRYVLASLAVGAVLLGGCASVAIGPSDEERVMERSQQRWDALLAGDLERVYGFLSPAQRSAIGSLAYQRSLLNSRVRWEGASVSGAECTPEVCTVTVDLDILVPSPVPGVKRYEIDQTVREQWIRADETWWYVPQ